MISVIRTDGDKVSGNNGQIVVIDREDECCIDGGIDQAEEIFFALESEVSTFLKSQENKH